MVPVVADGLRAGSTGAPPTTHTHTHTQQDLFSDATALDLPAAGQVPTHHASDLAPMEETRFLDTQG